LKQRTLVTLIGIAVLILAAVVYVTITSAGYYTTKLQCTDSGFVVYSVKAVNGSSTTYKTATTTTATVYATTTTNSATVGQVITATKAVRELDYTLPNGATIVSVSSVHSCTYVK